MVNPKDYCKAIIDDPNVDNWNIDIDTGLFKKPTIDLRGKIVIIVVATIISVIIIALLLWYFVIKKRMQIFMKQEINNSLNN